MARNGIFSHKADFENRYIPEYDRLAERIVNFRGLQSKCKVGFVSGVWDLIHEGHTAYIEKARDLVDLLVVGVDTDELTRKRKKVGEIDRPIIGFEERARLIAYMRAVDYITIVGEDYMSILAAIKPDVLVFSKSTKDLTAKTRAEYKPFVGKIVRLKPQAPPDKVSTTARVRSVLINGYNEAEQHVTSSVGAAIKSAFENLRSA